MDKHRLAVALSALWVLAAIPISQQFYDEALDGGFFMRIFALAVVAAPVWAFFGWRWVSNGAAIKPLYLALVVIVGVVASLFVSSDYYLKEIAYIPLAMATAFVVLAYAGAGVAPRKVADRKPTVAAIHPDKAKMLMKLDDDVGPLRETTELIMNRITKFMASKGMRSPIPEMIHIDADAAKTAYGMVYAAFTAAMKNGGKSRHTAILAMYKAQFLPGLTRLSLPRIEGMPSMSDKEIDTKTFRDPVMKLMQIYEEHGLEAIERTASKTRNPHYPLYNNLRPYVAPEATEEEMAAIFEEEFTTLYQLARHRVGRSYFGL